MITTLEEFQEKQNKDNIKLALARLQKRKHKAKTISPIKIKKSLEAAYRNILYEMVRKIFIDTNHRLSDAIPMAEKEFKKNSLVDVLQAIFRQIDDDSQVYERIAQAKASRTFDKMSDYNKQSFYKKAQSAMGVDIRSVITAPNVQSQIQLATAENFNLIKTLAQTEVARIKTIIYTQLSTGEFDTNVLRSLLRKEYGVSRRKANVIALDQTHKLNANLTRIRSEAVGVKKYIWRTANDLRVRGRPDGFYPKAKHNHWDRRNKEFYYSNPPPGGAPGIDYNCRCIAELVLPDIYNE